MTVTADTAATMSNVQLIDAMREELEELIRERHGSLNNYFREFGVDKRNFARTFKNKTGPDMLWVNEHVGNLNVPLDDYFARVVKRMQERP